jgi:hypothetical protein
MTLDDIEHQAVELIETHKQDAHSIYLEHLHTYDQRLNNSLRSPAKGAGVHKSQSNVIPAAPIYVWVHDKMEDIYSLSRPRPNHIIWRGTAQKTVVDFIHKASLAKSGRCAMLVHVHANREAVL